MSTVRASRTLRVRGMRDGGVKLYRVRPGDDDQRRQTVWITRDERAALLIALASLHYGATP